MKRLIIPSSLLDIILLRLCEQLIENHGSFENTVILGLQPKGVFLANRIKHKLNEIQPNTIEVGYLDISFNRDDFRRRPIESPSYTNTIPFLIENKKVILVDDVLYSGRTIRSALEAMLAYGRPSKVECLCLIDRDYSRELPIMANYVGKTVNTMPSQRVLVELKEQGFNEDNIWLITIDTNENA